MQIQANGVANTQVTETAKSAIKQYFRYSGVTDLDGLLMHWYKSGEFVCVSFRNCNLPDSQMSAYGQSKWNLLSMDHRNVKVDMSEGVFWVHRDCIEKIREQNRQRRMMYRMMNRASEQTAQ